MTLALARQKYVQGDTQAALELYRGILDEEPDNIDANLALADVYLAYKRDGLARPLLKNILAKDPGHFDAGIRLIPILFDTGKQEKVAAIIGNLLTNENITPDQYIYLCRLCQRVGKEDMARKLLNIILETHPNAPALHIELGRLLRNAGDVQPALQHFQLALENAPDNGIAQFERLSLESGNADADQINTLESLFQDSNAPPQSRVALAYALAKAYDSNDQVEQSFQYLREANALQEKMEPFSEKAAEQQLKRVGTTFSRSFFHQHSKVVTESDEPIFIVGMPRSGISLAEQILSSHSAVHGGGMHNDIKNMALRIQDMQGVAFPEGIRKFADNMLENFALRYLRKIRSLSNGARYVTNGTPGNYFYIGLITLLFPKAKIIHCKRNPMDTCYSIYKTQMRDPLPYSHDLETLGRQYGRYQKLMRHWHDVLPFRIYNLEYEELIENPDEEIGALLNYCGLPFDESCVNFYQNPANVKSPSAPQVTQPLYDSSKDSWLRYEQQLQPLVEALPK